MQTLNKLPVLDYLQRQVSGTLSALDTTHMKYPTVISQTLAIKIVEVALGGLSPLHQKT